ncbi:winged helix-turn-helix domain-containing protein [Synechococcus sp. PCC 6312]|uniref:winged helix-turn-helix domain-containing protein n=1 Tax=Synechococcus sp. (strain ATCC 27167 / PCC 6312) TaxID=195253 RepID=UPI000315006F|nr:response regulator transcription factor [Synechococcus sp. PCC 6312]
MLTLTDATDTLDLGKRRPATIFLVEDEDLIRDTIALALQDEGYAVVTASDGRQALDRINSQLLDNNLAAEAVLGVRGFDLIILDLMLPFVNGLDICRFLRREGCSVPILMLSAKGSEIDRVVGLEVGADDYLTKPFGMRELIARCRALIRRAITSQTTNEEDGPSFKYGELTLYPQECRVMLGTKEISLSPKEYRILELFMSYPRRVWPREQLLDRIWGPDFVGDSKTVDVHIRWLREKIEPDASHPTYIITVRGFGYRFG